jgi:hypothetical protein
MKEQFDNVQPLNIWRSLILVLLPAGIAALLIHFLVPVIVRQYSIPFLYAYLPWWIGFESLFFVGSFVAYRLEAILRHWLTSLIDTA